MLDAARKRNLSIVGVVNKVNEANQTAAQAGLKHTLQIDLPNSNLDGTTSEVTSLLGEGDPILPVSAKAGTGVTAVLDAIVQHIPPPKAATGGPLRALAFDSWYDEFKGVVSLVALASGALKKGKST